jgi:hypothetical protein
MEIMLPSLGTVRVMVIIGGGWGSRRRGYSPFGAGGYRRRYGGGGSCMRDVCLVESGCCLAEMLGCGPQLGLLGPSIVLRAVRGGVKRDRTGTGLTGQTRGVLVAGIRLYQQEISPAGRGPAAATRPPARRTHCKRWTLTGYAVASGSPRVDSYAAVCAGQRPDSADRVPIICGSPVRAPSSGRHVPVAVACLLPASPHSQATRVLGLPLPGSR